MADALGAIDDMLQELEHMPGVRVTPQQEPHILRLIVTLDTFDEPTWDRIIERSDELARTFGGELSVDLQMTLAA